MDRCVSVIFNQLFADDNRIFVVATIERHKPDQHVAAKCQLSFVGRGTIGNDLTFFNALARLDQRLLVLASTLIEASRAGKVTYVDSTVIRIGNDEYPLKKYVGLNERTCQNQKPLVKPGESVEKGQIIADGAATYKGQLALGRNVLVGFMSFDGCNYEDAIIILSLIHI